jgi:hypothetical protein
MTILSEKQLANWLETIETITKNGRPTPPVWEYWVLFWIFGTPP